MEMFNSPEVLTGSLKHLKQRKANLTRPVNLELGQDREASRRDKQPERPAPQQKKSRRFIDPQENAGRVSPDQDALSQNLNRSGSVEEEGFQQDRRPLPAPKRRKRTPADKPAATTTDALEPVTNGVSRRARGRPPRRQRIVNGDDKGGRVAAPVADGSTSTTFTTGRSNADPVTDDETHDDEDHPPSPPTLPQVHNYKMAKEVGRITTAARAKKKTQTRKAWTDLETETLINLISENGTSWKLLKDKDVGNVLVDRDQTALKDKARNMKFDFLK